LVMHRDGFVIDANPAGVALFGYKDLAEMIGRDMIAAFESGDSRERARRRLDELTALPAGQQLGQTDYRLLLRSGRRVAVRATGVQVDVDGGPAVLSIFIDDTERHAAEDAVRRSEAMLSHLVATSPDVITLTDLSTGRYAMVNRTFERLVGWRADEVVGKTSIELGVWNQPDDRARLLTELQDRGAVQNMPTHFVAKDGRVVQMLVSAARFSMDRRDYLVINARDVTESERLRLEREAILASASIGIAVTRDRRFVLANPFFEQMFGWPPGGLVGQPGQVVWPDAAAYADVGATSGPQLTRGAQVEIERRMRRRDGSSFLGRIVGKAIDPTQPVLGGTVWIVEDVTDRRQFEADLSLARDEAEAASRAKSAFLANTSHELRTPLNGMLGLVQLARSPGIDDGTRQQYLNQIAESAQSLADVITDILDLSKIEAGKL
ncbi:MAG: PAS domain S-box protein, partial [Rubrivivax sp.]|nr:PAS domain S-box protein [Rubrivivax sp.]